MTVSAEYLDNQRAQVAYAYELGIRTLWVMNGREAIVRVFQPNEAGWLGPMIARHDKPGTSWWHFQHPFVTKALRTAAREMTYAAAARALGKSDRVIVPPGMLPITPERVFVDVSPGVAVMLEA